MREQRCASHPVELCFETFGNPEDPLVLLIMGLGLDMLWWHEDVCRLLAAHGLYVARFDNRDVGCSTEFEGPVPTPWQLIRREAPTTYSLADMADDAARLIAWLGRPAHVVGTSMGSFIAQEVAIRWPDHVRSLVSVMGRPGDRRSGRVARTMMREFVRRAPKDPVEGMVGAFRRFGSPGRTAQDDEDVRVTMRASELRRIGDGTGGGRQLAAILAERDRTEDLRRLDLPALVIHGERDRIVLPSGGRATHAAIPGSRLVMVPDMGHDLPRHTWPLLLERALETFARAS